MVEWPEAYVLAKQINEVAAGRTIVEAEANHSPHGFAFFNHPSELYPLLLEGKSIISANHGTGHTCGGNVEIACGDKLLVISTPIRYYAPGSKVPAKHQLRLLLDDGASLTCTVQMWGAMMVSDLADVKFPEAYTINQMPEPVSDAFDYTYFCGMAEGKRNLSAKAFLATEQRIPGLGNGALQDVLYNCGIHPRQRLDALTEAQMRSMFESVKTTLRAMCEQGGRDTEKDLFGNAGGYVTKLSKKTKEMPCHVCGSHIVREAFLGGNIYFCPTCQPYEKKK